MAVKVIVDWPVLLLFHSRKAKAETAGAILESLEMLASLLDSGRGESTSRVVYRARYRSAPVPFQHHPLL
jgi:hypothetical protein